MIVDRLGRLVAMPIVPASNDGFLAVRTLMLSFSGDALKLSTPIGVLFEDSIRRRVIGWVCPD